MSSKADRAIRLISRIASEKVRKSRVPRRGVATWFPGFGVSMPVEEGAPGELTNGSVFPSLNFPVNGHPATPIAEGSRLTVNWPTEETDTGATLGAALPKKQDDHTIHNEIFGFN